MKQKELTKNQKEIVAQLNHLLSRALVSNIGIIHDRKDGSLSAINIEGVEHMDTESNGNNPVDWNKAKCISFDVYSFDSNYEKLYLDFSK